jgi:hypothetical protein
MQGSQRIPSCKRNHTLKIRFNSKKRVKKCRAIPWLSHQPLTKEAWVRA